MSNEFMREERYIVFKISDVERYLTDKDRANITMMKMEIDAGRDCANKPPFKGLIVEADWPEYEPTWKAIEARVNGAQPAPSVPDGWLRAVDEALVVAHIGVANASDTYEEAKAKLDSLIGFHVDVASDPAVNGGYKLMPIEPTHETLMDIVGAVAAPLSFREVRTIYDTVLAAPEAKPATSFVDAYQGAMEEVAIWKKRALEAEDLNRKFVAEINGPTYMGEPEHSKPDCGEAGHDEGGCGNRQCLPGAQGE